MTSDTHFHYCVTNALPFVIDGKAEAARGIMNIDVNAAIGMLQCISQGFSSNLDDLFANTGAHWELSSMSVSLDGSLPLFRKWRCGNDKRLV
jgi:hypothetical protein